MLAVFTAIDAHPRMVRARALAHAVGRKVAFVVDSACIAFVILTGLTFSLAGFDLVVAARLWGGFWTHYAAAPAASREPVLLAMVLAWLTVTLLTALVRALGKRGAHPAQDS